MASKPEARDVPEAVRRADVSGSAWWALSGLIDGSLESRDVAVMASLLRVLLAAGDAGPADDAALREVELRGRLMHGLPPRDAGEWGFMRERFSPEAVAEAGRWLARFEGDALDGVNPGVLG